MTGPEHYREAERLIVEAREVDVAADDLDLKAALWALSAAQVHATLALAAATGLGHAGFDEPGPDTYAWRRVASAALSEVQPA